MASSKLIEVEIEDLAGLGGIITTYKEIAATRITRNRSSILKSHIFLSEINEIFQHVKDSYKRELVSLAKKKKIKDISKLSFIKHNGKTLIVFLSSNTGLYGNIIERTFEMFERDARNSGHDIAVMGRLGLTMVEKAEFPPPYAYFDFPDSKVDDKKLQEIALYLLKYEKVIVYYQEFRSIVRQDPITSDISGNLLPSEQNTSTPIIRYLFEPSLERVLEFFEKEIFAIILEQTIRDSQLAKFASRLVTLDTASENIKKQMKLAVSKAVRLRHRVKNLKQNQTFSSMSLWG